MKLINFSDIKDSNDLPNEELKNSFYSFKDAQVFLLEPEEMMLWRFAKGHENPFSHCWVDTANIEQIFRSFSQIKAQNEFGIESTSVMVENLIRDQLAILKAWKSQPNFIVGVQIKKEVVAFKGKIGFQTFFEDIDKTGRIQKIVERRLGGLEQIVIPRFYNNFKNGRAGETKEYLNTSYFQTLAGSSWYKKYTW